MKNKRYTLKEICEGIAEKSDIELFSITYNDYIRECQSRSNIFNLKIDRGELSRKIDAVLTDSKNKIKKIKISPNYENGLSVIYCSYKENNRKTKDSEALYIKNKRREIFVKNENDSERGFIFANDLTYLKAQELFMESDENYKKRGGEDRTGKVMQPFCSEGNLLGVKKFLDYMVFEK